MALPSPDETLMGVTQYKPRKKQTPVVPIRVERREPPKVLNKPGMSEWVGTQKPTEQQKPEEPKAPPISAPLNLETWAYNTYKIKDLTKNEKKALAPDYNTYVESVKATNAQYAAYNASVKTYNEAIGHKTPAENKAIAERLLKKTQPKTVMS